MRGKPKETEAAPTKSQQTAHGQFCSCILCRFVSSVSVKAPTSKTARAGRRVKVKVKVKAK